MIDVAIVFLGALVVVTGIVSLIAANWELIPPAVKLANTLVFLILLVAGAL